MSNNIAPGYQVAGISSGIKKNGEKDLGIIVAESPSNVAGVFTRNRVKAAPVMLDMERIQSGTCQAVIVNSGNANCSTGDRGMADAQEMTRCVAAELGLAKDEVLVASTGVIGEPLPMDNILAAVPLLIQSCGPDKIDDFARSIMTTDTVPKVVTRQGVIQNKTYTITGTAKGSGMIRPDMATLLGFVCTDIDAAAVNLKEMLVTANERSFNRITIDGDTSTNDTVLLMANGLSGAAVIEAADREAFQADLDAVLIDLAKMIVKDGEGATKLVEIVIRGAASTAEARMVADTVAHSNLVKTALFGEDANWGRIMGAVGRAGISLDPDAIDIFFNDIQMVNNGLGTGKDMEAKATKVLKMAEFVIAVDLNMGSASASVFTCDFSIDYVKINADYRT